MASFKINNTYLSVASTISSKNEETTSDFNVEDLFLGKETSEDAEKLMQEKVVNKVLEEVVPDIVIGADLSNQLAITNKAMSNFDFPYLGIYNACSSFTEAIIIASSMLKMPKIKNVMSLISSHNLNAERTYRYPIEYGSPRRNTQTFTATSAVSSIITKKETKIKVESCTIGKVIDYGIKDVNNMGAVMAPAAANTLIEHLKAFDLKPNYYNLILTGDLGKVGSQIFKELLKKENITNFNYMDAGEILITDKTLTDCGASGPACLPLVLYNKILKLKKYKRILIIGTGALHNTTLINQKKSIPAIAHAVALEVSK